MLHTERSQHDGERVTMAGTPNRPRSPTPTSGRRQPAARVPSHVAMVTSSAHRSQPRQQDLEAQRLHQIKNRGACRELSCREVSRLEIGVFLWTSSIALMVFFLPNNHSCTSGFFRAFLRYLPLFYFALCGKMIVFALEKDRRVRFGATVHALPLMLAFVYCVYVTWGEPIVPMACRGIVETQPVQSASPSAGIITPRSPPKVVTDLGGCITNCAVRYSPPTTAPSIFELTQSQWAECFKVCLENDPVISTSTSTSTTTAVFKRASTAVPKLALNAVQKRALMRKVAQIILSNCESKSVEG